MAEYVITVVVDIDPDDYATDPLTFDSDDLRSLITARWPDEMRATIQKGGEAHQ